jgi:hypothetical protein
VSDLTSLIMFAAGALFGIVTIETVTRRSDVGVALVLAVLVLRESTPHVDLTVLTSPVRVGPNDLLVVVLLGAAVARLLRARRLTLPQWLTIAILVLVIWSVARGAGPFGVPASVNEARKFFQFGSALLYFSTVEFRRDLFNRFGRMWLIAASVLCAITIARWIGNAAGLRSGFFEGYADVRVIPAAMTLILAQAAIVSFPLLLRRDRSILRFLAPIFLVFVVLLQHRTVWIATAFGTLYLLWRERALAQRALNMLVVAAALFGVFTLTVFDDQQSDVTEQLASSAQRTGTFEWRYQGWVALLTDAGPRNAEEALTGLPFGRGWTRTLAQQQVVEVSPHNFYVETFLRIGVAGLVAMLLIYYLGLKATWRSPRHDHDPGLLNPSILHVTVAMQLLFYITYSPDFAQAMLLGLAASVVQSSGYRPGRASPYLENRDAARPHLRLVDLPQPRAADRPLSAFHLRSRR